MAIPKTMDELRPAGYTFLDTSTCSQCGDAIEWWSTPRGARMPINPMERGLSKVVVHFDTCTERDQ